MNLTPGMERNSCRVISYYRGLADALSTKIGISLDTLMGPIAAKLDRPSRLRVALAESRARCCADVKKDKTIYAGYLLPVLLFLGRRSGSVLGRLSTEKDGILRKLREVEYHKIKDLGSYG